MEDFFGLAGKVAIVWGGGLGMGESTALYLAKAGCDVAIVDMVPERAEHVAASIRALGRRSKAYTANVTVEHEVEETVAAVETDLGPLDVMVTVIGVGVWATVVEMTLDQWDTAQNINLKGFFISARAVARSMIKGGRSGSILAVSSVSGLTSSPNNAAYGAAKAGLVNLVRTMALEWGPHHIRVNTIAPGSIVTPRVQPGPEVLEIMKRKIPATRPGTTDEIGKAALFLSSDLASYVSGSTLPVDGGWMSTFLMDPNADPKPAS